ncbi:helix-turn-helix domain-containing protein [Paenibacillus macquariensis]|uniref:Helix-turn-helix n=1 Tax=Paenibacillus macquariensis TaxID=948756 RepID=A0ABY1JN49_9BACL|nr:helix-turn-helix transcriptional regulator [Paenibacillus macquariensis]MEC0092216.1 helix-turn-helix transcriptional regulator [Paenibacillus macquariensis]OAB37236.1 transcriptional regulator [Paenibacillus macquariensis subsp. macquariensis]SIQ48734.1 Helix-turn-helix [Paenibacillus macquariensis]
MDYIQLGSRLRKERLKHNFTQERLAEKIDVSHAYIGQIERGERSLTLETLIKLANQLEVTADELLHESLKMNEGHFIHKIIHLVQERPIDEQQMALNMLEVMFAHLDQMNSISKDTIKDPMAVNS